MGIKQFFRSLFSSTEASRTPQPEDSLAADVRETMGPQGGGSAGGRMTGGAVYHHVEDRHGDGHDTDYRRSDD